jgi:DNA-3-methyladenine glycosylase
MMLKRASRVISINHLFYLIMILKRKFYERETLTVAGELLGELLVHETEEGATAGKIVETEAYLGPEDKASHAYGGLRTSRTEAQFGPKGHAYIYFVYGMYYCFNVTSGRIPEKPEAILVRALEPVSGVEIMKKRRALSKGRRINLANGPGKLCMAMGISTDQNGADLCSRPLHIDEGEKIRRAEIVQTTRINVDYAGEWKSTPWRFFVKNNAYVSRPTKE